MGRQREFNECEALERAMAVFWRQGYGDTSIDDIVEETGVSRYGLYSAFGDKHQLFLAALDRYAESTVASITSPLAREGASLPELREFFDRMLTMPRPVEMQYGCLLCSSMTELAAVDPEVAKRCDSYSTRLRDLIRDALAQAQQKGEVRDDVSVDALSATIFTQMLGIAALSKSPGAESIVQDAFQALTTSLEVIS